MGTHEPPDAGSLHAALQAWNTRAQESTIPLLAHCHASIRALRKLVILSRRYHTLDASQLEPREDSPAAIDPVRALRDLSSQLQRVEQLVTEVSENLEQAEHVGEFLAREFATLARNSTDIAAQNDGIHELGAETNGEFADDNQLLAQLVEAQKVEIELLKRSQKKDKARRRGKQDVEKTSPATALEIHSIHDFLHDSPIAEFASNPSYYQRLLEAAGSPDGQRVPMGELLTIAGLISERQLTNALGHQQNSRRRPLGSLLVDLGYTNEDAIAQALAAQLALPFVVLEREFVREGAITKVPVHIAKRHACFPLNFTEEALTVAMANPLDLIALEDLHIASGMHIKPCVASRNEIDSHIALYYI